MKRWIVVLQGICMIVISAGAAVSFLSNNMVPAAAYAGWVIAGLGVISIATGVRALNRNLTIWVEPLSQLVTGGVYRYTRNPIYVGGLLMSAGWSLMFLSPICAAGTAALAVVLNLKIRLEEAELVKKFGAAYKTYRKSTPRWVWKF